MSAFIFIKIEDCGLTSCPHCGAQGRYVYTWKQDGVIKSAMAGCYKALTGRLEKDEYTKYCQLLAEKQVKNKPLSGWDKRIIRLQTFLSEGKYTEEWIMSKINDVLRERKYFLSKINH